jgi:hypothetical protein
MAPQKEISEWRAEKRGETVQGIQVELQPVTVQPHSFSCWEYATTVEALYCFKHGRGSSVNMTRLRAGQPGFDFQHGQGRDLLCSSLCPDRLRGPPSLLSNAYRRLFPRG